MDTVSDQSFSRPAFHATGLRSVPLATWVLLALAVIDLGMNASNEWSSVPTTLATAGVLVFSAFLLWAAPADRPLLRYGAWTIAASALLLLIPAFMSQDPVASTPMLAGAAYWLAIVASFVLVVGVVLVSIAYGVIHSSAGWTVFWIGVLIAVSGMGLVTMRPAEEVGPFDVLVLSATQAVPVAWAYMCAVFLGINRWFARGAAMMLVYIAMTQLVAWLSLGPDTNFAYVRFGLGLLDVIAWALLIGAALTLRPSGSKEALSPGR